MKKLWFSMKKRSNTKIQKHFKEMERMIESYLKYDDRMLILEWYALKEKDLKQEGERRIFTSVHIPFMVAGFTLMATIGTKPLEQITNINLEYFKDLVLKLEIDKANNMLKVIIDVMMNVVLLGGVIVLTMLGYGLLISRILNRKNSYRNKIRILIIEQILKERGIFSQDMGSKL